jgi:hypothetical protein
MKFNRCKALAPAKCADGTISNPLGGVRSLLISRKATSYIDLAQPNKALCGDAAFRSAVINGVVAVPLVVAIILPA